MSQIPQRTASWEGQRNVTMSPSNPPRPLPATLKPMWVNSHVSRQHRESQRSRIKTFTQWHLSLDSALGLFHLHAPKNSLSILRLDFSNILSKRSVFPFTLTSTKTYIQLNYYFRKTRNLKSNIFTCRAFLSII